MVSRREAGDLLPLGSLHAFRLSAASGIRGTCISRRQRDYNHHLETYGHPSEFGYHDFVPMFKAEHFDADEWADSVPQTGARFAGPVAEHHDGFSMWDSDVTPWNAHGQGAQTDITGELAAALRDRGIKLITTFHHARNLQRDSRKSCQDKATSSSTIPSTTPCRRHRTIRNCVFSMATFPKNSGSKKSGWGS